MGFIYSRPLSVEGIFSKFDTDRSGDISRKEAKAAKKINMFTAFKVNKNMTLKEFESINLNAYASYERAATEAYNKQKEKVKQWLMDKETALQTLIDKEYEEMELIEHELVKEKDELELELLKQKQQNY